MKLKAKQKGFLSAGTLALIILFAIFLVCLGKLGPHYLDNHYIKSSLRSLARDTPNFAELNNKAILSELESFMTINNVRGEEADSFYIVRKNDEVLVNSVYEIRVPFFLNVEVILTFENQLSSQTPELCCRFLVE